MREAYLTLEFDDLCVLGRTGRQRDQQLGLEGPVPLFEVQGILALPRLLEGLSTAPEVPPEQLPRPGHRSGGKSFELLGELGAFGHRSGGTSGAVPKCSELSQQLKALTSGAVPRPWELLWRYLRSGAQAFKKAWQSEYTLHLEERNRALETELLVALSSSAAKDAEIVKLKSKVSLPHRTSSLDLHSSSHILHSSSHIRDTQDPRASQPTLFGRRSQSCKGSCM